MATREELLELETRFWTDGAEFYAANVDQQCTLVFSTMAARMSRDEVVASIANAPRWEPPTLRFVALAEPAPDVALLTYEADARRADGTTLRAYVSSGYVRRAGGWKLTFHQQTPHG